VANLVITPVSAGGSVSLYNGSGGSVELVADVSGYYVAGTATASGMFAPLAPYRLLDTRSGIGAPKLAVGAGQTLRVQVDGVGPMPRSAVAALVLNVTVTAPQTAGYVTVWGGGARPSSSDVNFSRSDRAEPRRGSSRLRWAGVVLQRLGRHGAAHR
jgi:hypothetical protein